jgi:hypothetical protein
VIAIERGPGERLMVGVFESVQHAADAVAALLEQSFEEGRFGFLMSDRAAERHFGPLHAHQDLGSPKGGRSSLQRLAARLRPVAPLGTTGAGLVATGPLAALLVAAGLGCGAGLERAFQVLGLSAEEARELTRRVKNGALLLSMPAPQPDDTSVIIASSVQHAMSVLLHLDRPCSNPAVVTRPRAPAGDQRARYAPIPGIEEATRAARSGAH